MPASSRPAGPERPRRPAPRRPLPLALPLALLLIATAACGGGGPPPFRVTLAPTPASVVTLEGQAGVVRIDAAVSGEPAGDLFFSAVADGPGIDRVEIEVSSPTAAVLWIYSDASLPPGTFRGTLRILLCSDAACTHTIGGSPFSIAFSVQVKAVLKTSPGRLELESQSGTPTSAWVAVQPADGQSSFEVEVGATPPWLAVSDVTAEGFRVTVSGVPIGTYFGSIQVRSGPEQIALRVSYAATAAPGGQHDLVLPSALLMLEAFEGSGAPTQLLLVSPPTWNPPLSTSIEYVEPARAGWLGLTPTAGGYQVEADAAALPKGVYHAWITVAGVDQYTTAQRCLVYLTVAQALVAPADRTLAVTSVTGEASLHGLAQVGLAGGPVQGWTAASDAAWLILDTPSGTAPGALAYHVDRAALAALPNGQQAVATVAVAGDLAAVSPAPFRVILDKRLAEVTGIAPSARLAGARSRVLAHGLGFDALSDPAAAVRVVGIPGTAVVRRADGELELDVPAAAAGDYPVRADNALGLPVGAGVLTLVDEPAYQAASLPSPGEKSGLAYDPVTQALFTADLTNERILRFAWSGTGWAVTSTDLPLPRGVALSPDRTLLVALQASNLVLLDPVTLGVLEAYPLPDTPPAGGAGDGTSVAITNDGRVWLKLGFWPRPRRVAYFDLETRSFVEPGLDGLYATLTDGLRYSASADGGRLLMLCSPEVSPKELLWRDTREGTFRPVPGTFTSAPIWESPQAEDGSRILFRGTRYDYLLGREYGRGDVYDAAYARLGTAEPPAGWRGLGSVQGGVFSPDGTRLYLVVHPEDAYSLAAAPPRIHVFDTSRAQPSLTAFPLLGAFDLPGYPACQETATYRSCLTQPWPALSLDGRTLFLVGDAAFLAVPIPAGL